MPVIKKHIERLNSIRFLAAAWVAMSHGALPIKQFGHGAVGNFLLSAFNASFSGISAVIVFFIVSGICIHFPNVEISKLSLPKYYVRRYVRIGIPLVAVLILAYAIGDNVKNALNSVVWSVYAEIFYYTLYPFIFKSARSFGWHAVLLISVCGTVSALIGCWNQMEVSSLGWVGWLWGLPIWISGCIIAELFARGQVSDIGSRIWAWRAGALIYSIVATYFEFHSSIRIGYPISRGLSL